MVYFLPVSFMTNFKETTGYEICKKLTRSSRIAMSELVAWFLGFSIFDQKIISRKTKHDERTAISSEFRLFRGMENTRSWVSFRRIKRYMGFRFVTK